MFSPRFGAAETSSSPFTALAFRTSDPSVNEALGSSLETVRYQADESFQSWSSADQTATTNAAFPAAQSSLNPSAPSETADPHRPEQPAVDSTWVPDGRAAANDVTRQPDAASSSATTFSTAALAASRPSKLGWDRNRSRLTSKYSEGRVHSPGDMELAAAQAADMNDWALHILDQNYNFDQAIELKQRAARRRESLRGEEGMSDKVQRVETINEWAHQVWREEQRLHSEFISGRGTLDELDDDGTPSRPRARSHESIVL